MHFWVIVFGSRKKIPGKICQCELTSSEFFTAVTDCWPDPLPYLTSWLCSRTPSLLLANLITLAHVTGSSKIKLSDFFKVGLEILDFFCNFEFEFSSELSLILNFEITESDLRFSLILLERNDLWFWYLLAETAERPAEGTRRHQIASFQRLKMTGVLFKGEKMRIQMKTGRNLGI